MDIKDAFLPIASLRVFDGNAVESPEVKFPIYHSGYYSVNDAGNTPQKSSISFDGIDVEEGGYLQYTLEGNSRNQKITVHCPTSGYIPGTLWVRVDPPGNAGSKLSDPDSLGSNVVGTKTGNDGKSGYIPIPASESPEDVILNVKGGKAWTDGKKNGAKIVYSLSGDPGVEAFQIVYTLLSE